MTYTITINKQFNSTEISFDEVPTKAAREALKTLRFRWHSVKKVWYGYKTPEEVRNVLDQEKQPEPKAAQGNKYGVKVGDVFIAVWGYDQTNNTFIKGVDLVGSSSVKVVEVSPSYTVEWSTGMAENRKLQQFDGKLLPKLDRSVFIDDQNGGDLKRILPTKYHDCGYYIKLDNFAYAYPTMGGNTIYESWYA